MPGRAACLLLGVGAGLYFLVVQPTICAIVSLCFRRSVGRSR